MANVRGDEAREIVRLVTSLIFYLLHLSVGLQEKLEAREPLEIDSYFDFDSRSTRKKLT